MLASNNQNSFEEEPLFTFVVSTDSHVMLEEGDESSAYPSSIREFNRRSRYLVEEINRLSPDFYINLGDFVQPVPSLPIYEPAVQNAKEIFSKLDPEMYVTPGNHDIGDKKAGWMPGPKIDDQAIQVFEKHWGKAYSSFDYQDVHFVLVNTPVINSGLDAEEEQRVWLEKDLEGNKDKRIFMFTHYPLYLRYPDEDEHYDNIAEPGRSWLLSLIENYNVETLYAGHVHNYFYNEYANSKQFVLPALSFVRPDYNELFQIEGGPEGGRNDIYKFGFFFVKVYKDRVVNQLIRTFGKGLDIEEELNSNREVVASYHTLEKDHSPIGVYLRHAWAENHFIPFANLDEFNRKVVRNDYPLLSIWDLGIKKIRIPMGDYYLADTLERIKSLKAMGHSFTVFSTGLPTERVMKTLAANQDYIDHWEVSVSQDEMKEIASYLQEIKSRTPIKVFVSKIQTSADTEGGNKYHHFIRHGFNPNDDELMEELQTTGILKWVDGLVFNMTPEQSPFERINQAKKMADRYQLEASIHVQMRGSDTPAYEHRDDLAIANRIAEVVISTVIAKEVEVFLDTFIDHDRGYFVRNGLIDRKNNPRLQYHVFKYLSSVLQQLDDCKVVTNEKHKGYKIVKLESASSELSIVLPDNADAEFQIEQFQDFNYLLNLETGEIQKASVSQSIHIPSPFIVLTDSVYQRLDIEGKNKDRIVSRY